MKKVLVIALSALLGGFLVISCFPEATEDEIKQMCANLSKLRGESALKPVSELTAEINRRFEDRKTRFENRQARDLKALDDELAAKLKELDEAEAEKPKKKAKGDEEEPALEEKKKSLQEEYEEKKNKVKARFAGLLKDLAPQKEEALEKAKKKHEKDKVEAEKASQKCIEDAKKQGVKQKLAQCRINADSVDKYWNICN